MNRRTTAFIFISFTFLMFSAVVSTLMSCQNKESVQVTKPTAPLTEPVTAKTEYNTYIVKEYNGFVAVFDANSLTPITITDRYVSALPEDDRKKLAEGIRTNSEIKMKRLIEDLCS